MTPPIAPTVHIGPDGTVLVDWPNPRPDEFTITADAFQSLIDIANTFQCRTRTLLDDGTSAAPIIQPGDTLLIDGPDGQVTAQQAYELRAALMAKLPGIANVAILGGVRLAGIYRPEVTE